MLNFKVVYGIGINTSTVCSRVSNNEMLPYLGSFGFHKEVLIEKSFAKSAVGILRY
jgi:hypothetical protein